MLVLLPPSETKAGGGDGPPLDFAALSFADLTPTRRKVADALVDLAADGPASLAALGLSDRQRDEVARNAALYRSPTVPALARYTGVLYDALDAGSLTRAQRARVGARVAVASALFGLVGGDDPIPAYRCSAGAAPPALGPLGAVWRPVLQPILADVDELVVDLRSGAYAALARRPDALTVRVVSVDARGRRTTVSHHNKASKGRLARLLGVTRKRVDSVDDVLSVASAGGLRVLRTGAWTADLVV